MFWGLGCFGIWDVLGFGMFWDGCWICDGRLVQQGSGKLISKSSPTLESWDARLHQLIYCSPHKAAEIAVARYLRDAVMSFAKQPQFCGRDIS